MSLNQGFSFVAKGDAKILILGSMPSSTSLQEQQYYAHPRNAFWKIMAQLFDFPENLNYPDKLIALQKHNLCLWDVIQSCERRGSLDSNINNQSIIPNDFVEFFRQNPHISHLFFNGSRAEQEYKKRVLPNLPIEFQSIKCLRLPSTSPAMASLNFEKKLAAWMIVKRALEIQ